jgi:hypothetical protein
MRSARDICTPPDEDDGTTVAAAGAPAGGVVRPLDTSPFGGVLPPPVPAAAAAGVDVTGVDGREPLLSVDPNPVAVVIDVVVVDGIRSGRNDDDMDTAAGDVDDTAGPPSAGGGANKGGVARGDGDGDPLIYLRKSINILTNQIRTCDNKTYQILFINAF